MYSVYQISQQTIQQLLTYFSLEVTDIAKKQQVKMSVRSSMQRSGMKREILKQHKGKKQGPDSQRCMHLPGKFIRSFKFC